MTSAIFYILITKGYGVAWKNYYSRLSITRTFKGNRKRFGVKEILGQITGE